MPACSKKCKLYIVMALAAIMATSSSAADRGHSFTYSGSLQYSTGTYLFEERTNSFYFTNSIQYSYRPITLSLSVPLVWQDSPWLTYSGVGLIPSGGAQHESVKKGIKQGKILLPDTSSYSQIGIGDPMLHFCLDAIREQSILPAVSLTADLKIPWADVDQGFGTGEWDYAAGMSLSKTFGRTMLFLDGSYWVMGDLPYLELQDTFAYSLSAGRLLRRNIGVMASFSGNTAAQEGVDPPLQLGLGVNKQLRSGAGISGSVFAGLTDTAPDISFSIGYRMGL